ncbi:MAG: hypothetical protein NC132_00620 [Corallococcus sp.]|nr:hypothetical protein [Corallococcus sp.]MCM1359220.1 hypothetical protein [Corallococcus sp.]MCM1394610.1 hypothetical protein [Corallococcus sp.]
MFVEYEYTLEDEKRNAKQLVCFLYRRLLLPAVVSAAMGVAIVVLALTVFAEEKIFLWLGCLLLIAAAFIALSFVVVYVSASKSTEKAFSIYSAGGKERFSIEYSDGTYIFCNLSKGDITRYSASDIASATLYKNLLLLKLVSKQIICCPNDARTCQLFAGYISKKK